MCRMWEVIRLIRCVFLEASPPTVSISSNEGLPFHSPSVPASAGPCSSETMNYYPNYYYPPADPYYYSYGTSAAASQYTFLNPFNYNPNEPQANISPASFLHFQQPFLSHWNSNEYSNSSAPVTNEYEESWISLNRCSSFVSFGDHLYPCVFPMDNKSSLCFIFCDFQIKSFSLVNDASWERRCFSCCVCCYLSVSDRWLSTMKHSSVKCVL